MTETPTGPGLLKILRTQPLKSGKYLKKSRHCLGGLEDWPSSVAGVNFFIQCHSGQISVSGLRPLSLNPMIFLTHELEKQVSTIAFTSLNISPSFRSQSNTCFHRKLKRQQQRFLALTNARVRWTRRRPKIAAF